MRSADGRAAVTGVASPPLALYVHLPWCVAKCPYCDFNSHTIGKATSLDDYVSALAEDIRTEAAFARGRDVETVFIGGGTPSLFGPRQIEKILDTAARELAIQNGAEITMEANPGAVERGKLAAYREAGVNRLSLGAQSFDAGSLKRLGRIHGPDEVTASYAEAREAGFASINLDLMFALPEQTIEAAVADVEHAIALDPEHLSYYQLTLEPNTVFFSRPPRNLPNDELSSDIQEAGHERLALAGYERYEVSAFARPGLECRHNLNYWSFGDYLGVGAGAHGKRTDENGRIWRTQKVAHPVSYMRDLRAGSRAGSSHELECGDIPFEFMLNALRLRSGFSASSFTARTGLAFDRLEASLWQAQADGMLERDGVDRWRATELGFRFLNDLQARFLPPGDTTRADNFSGTATDSRSTVMHKSSP